MTTTESKKCDVCGANITPAEGNTLQDAIDWHMAYDHEPMEIVDKDAETTKPKAKAKDKPTKAQRKAQAKATVEEVGIPLDVPVVDTKPTPKPKHVYTCVPACGYTSEYKIALLSHQQACDLAGKPFPVRTEEKAPVAQKSEMPNTQGISLAAMRETLISMKQTIKSVVQNTFEQAEADAEFFKEIHETDLLIKSLRDETLPELKAIESPYRNDALINKMEGFLAEMISKLAVMKADIRYVNGKVGVEKIAMAKNLRQAQEQAAEHNAEVTSKVTADAQEWIHSEIERFECMLYGEIYVPRSKDTDGAISHTVGDKTYYGISFMHDTMWRLNSELKKVRGDKWWKDLKPADIKEVWNTVFNYQMERYEFVKSREFVYMGKRARVDEQGAIKLGATESFEYVAELPFEHWSTTMLNSAIAIQKENRGSNLITLLDRYGYQCKDGTVPKILGPQYLSYATEKYDDGKTEMQIAYEKAQGK